MPYQLLIDPRASQDIQNSIDYYEDLDPGLGKYFEHVVNDHLMLLKSNPFFQRRYEDIHCLPMKKFPFMIHYQINENDSQVIIRAVFSTHRNPDIWSERGK